MGVKEERENYKNWNSEMSEGRIKKANNHFKIVEYRDGTPGQEFNVEINEKRITFLGPDGYLKKLEGMKLKGADL